jgi:CRISPR-associated protein Csb2
MPLVVTIQLLSATYDAAQVDDREQAEWPPHPARLFCGLVAAARGPAERAALKWLEHQPPPVVHAAARPRESRHQAYVVKNTVVREGKSQTHPGRTNNLRARTRAHPASPTVRMIWPAEPDPLAVAALDAMARRIPYLGRSTGIALVSASAGSDDNLAAAPPGDTDTLAVFEPCDLLHADTSLRVPYAGYLEALDAQYDAGRPAWEVRRYRGYRQVPEPPASLPSAATTPHPVVAATPSVYPDVVAFRFSGVRPDARLTVRFTNALRRATLAAAGTKAPAALHGHGADGRPHVAFLALPDVGSEHADGHLLGLAIAVPELPEHERRVVLHAVLGLRHDTQHGLASLDVPDIGLVELLYQPGLVRPWGGSPDRWRQGSRRWVSATPVVLDRYPKRPADIEHELLAGARTVGLPEPIDLQISADPLLTGAARLRPIDLPRHTKGRLYRHVALTFDRVVHGPVLLGAGRYLGIGLLAPAPLRGTHG